MDLARMSAEMVVREWRKQTLLNGNQGNKLMYGNIYNMRDRNMFDLIDQCLDWIDLKDFPDRFIMGVLTITASCARQLTRREDFFKDVEARFTMKHGSKKASKMLKGLAREEGWRPIKEVRHADRETGDATRVTHQADT